MRPANADQHDGTRNTQPVNSQSILQTLTDTYAALKSYQDNGVVLTQFPDKDKPDEIHFSTWFKRPRLFRFDWTTHHPYEGLRHEKTSRSIWRNEEGTFWYSDREKEIEREESLGMAIAGATGVSKGAAHNVPGLLMRRFAGFYFTELLAPVVDELEYRGRECYHVQANHPNGDPWHLTISKADFLLQKARHIMPDTGVIIEDCRDNIQTNHEIEENIFNFQPNNS